MCMYYRSYVCEYGEKKTEEILLDKFPNITNKQIKEFNSFYWNIPLTIALQAYKNILDIREWNKSKNKHYYWVKDCRGIRKIVYMCEEMVKYFYGNKYEVI